MLRFAHTRTLKSDRLLAWLRLEDEGARDVAQRDRALVQVAAEDWEILFAAVSERLALIVGGQLGAPPRIDPALWARTQVLECVQALEQLQLSAQREFDGRLAVVAAAQRMLVKVCIELAGTWPEQVFDDHELDAALAQSRARRQALAVLYLELDGLDQIQATHGPAVGDELLRILTARLDVAARAAEGLGRERLGCLAAQMVEAAATPLRIGAHDLRVRPRIGMAVFPTDGLSSSLLLQHADAALQRARQQQKSYAFFD